ncbi:hypothetical protein J7J90_01860 [Candidatus Micrarchaeota archaeon]|nr:hypothetical protein [Candidatus Micrarchaeota archaeon]
MDKEIKHSPEFYYNKLIINRYSKHITENEEKSITGLKQMIDPENPTIKRIIKELLESNFNEFGKGDNNFENIRNSLTKDDKKKIARRITEYLSKIKTIKSEVVFWPTFEEIDFIMAGDPMDKAIFGASLFLSIGILCKICSSEDEKHYLVYDIGDERYFYQIETNDLYKGTKLDLLLSKGIKFKYCFDNEKYTTFD